MASQRGKVISLWMSGTFAAEILNPHENLIFGVLMGFIRGRKLDHRAPSDHASRIARYELGFLRTTQIIKQNTPAS